VRQETNVVEVVALRVEHQSWAANLTSKCNWHSKVYFHEQMIYQTPAYTYQTTESLHNLAHEIPA
jgi:hypothetical protein